MTDQILVMNAGPIEGVFPIDLSRGPGAYELRGGKGTGKSTVMASLDWLAGHKVDITLHDGEMIGSVKGFGVVAPIGGRKRRKGEMPLDTIDTENFSLSDLVAPPGKTAEVRDRHAIKALAVLSEAKADLPLYYALAGGQAAFDALGIALTIDPVVLATRVKSAFDRIALDATRTAEAEAKHAEPLEFVPAGLDMAQPCDLTVLGKHRDEARDAWQKRKDDRETGLTKLDEIREATERLAELTTSYELQLTVETAQKLLVGTVGDMKAADRKVFEIEENLLKAKASQVNAVHNHQLVRERLETARQHEEAMRALKATAEQEVTCPSVKDVSEAHAAVDWATDAHNQGVRIRDVKANQSRATLHRDTASEAEAHAADAKNKAGQVFGLLAKSLNTKHIEIRDVDGNPRLFVQHPKRGRCLFDRVNGLSDGERVDYALQEVLPHIEKPGLLALSQPIWQDLQPSDRMALHELAIERGLFLFGAQIDEGELRVEYLGERKTT